MLNIFMYFNEINTLD